MKQQHRHANRAAIGSQIKEFEDTLAWLKRGDNPPPFIQTQIQELARKRERLLKDLRETPEDVSAEKEAAQVKRLLQRILKPKRLNLRNIMTGKQEVVTVRDTRSLLKLLKQDLSAGRAVLRSLVEDVVLRPVGDEVKITIRGTLGNALSGLLTADDVLSFRETSREARCPYETHRTGTDSAPDRAFR